MKKLKLGDLQVRGFSGRAEGIRTGGTGNMMLMCAGQFIDVTGNKTGFELIYLLLLLRVAGSFC